MGGIAYTEWLKLYNEDVERSWYTEPHQELRSIAMLLQVFDGEYKRIRTQLKNEYMLCAEKIKSNKISLRNCLYSEKENTHNGNNMSPEMFACTPKPPFLNDSMEKAPNCNIVDTSDEDSINTNASPKINRLHKLRKLRQRSMYTSLDLSRLTPPKVKRKENVFNDIVDSTILETTPKKVNISNKIKQLKKPDKMVEEDKSNNSFSKSTINTYISSKTKYEDSNNSDATYCPDGEEITSPDVLVNVTKRKKLIDSVSKDARVDLNKIDVITLCSPINDGKIDETKVPDNKLIKRNPVFKEPTVRGKARLKLEGWDCADCKNFYDGMDLGPQDIKKILNKCSRHRSKFKPEDYTPKGFWDLDFPPTQAPVKNTYDSTYFQY